MAENKNTNKKTMEFTSKQGTKYTFQKVQPIAWLDIMDEVEAEKEGQRRKLYTATVENIIVQPQMALEDFDDYGEMEDVITAAIRFQRGK